SEKHPRVVIRGDIVAAPSYRFPGLRNRTHDLVLSPAPPADYPLDELNVEILFDDPWVVVAGANSRWARRHKVELRDLVDEPWLITPPYTASSRNLEQAFKSCGLNLPAAGMVTHSVHLRAKLAMRGKFITVVPKSMLRIDGGGQLKMLP